MSGRGRRSGNGPGPGDARGLLVRYLEQMQELGESEVYLSPEMRLAVRRAQPSTISSASASSTPRSAPTSSGEKPASAPSGAKPSPSELAAAIPEPEVIQATLVVTRGSGTSDMFSKTASFDGCSSLSELEKMSETCEKCELAQGRTKVVFGIGNPNATLMFIGEAPGRDEDLSGIPFVGRAGQLLDKVLAAADIARDNVYIGNIIKCRPPNNRTPLTSEIDACMPYLARQLQCIKPSIICTLGLPATHTLLGVRGSMGSLRGKIYMAGDIVVVPTYHPAAALRDPRYKKPIWEDFLIVKREYDRAGGDA
jgi:uracil-DNA glycosylase family 4